MAMPAAAFSSLAGGPLGAAYPWQTTGFGFGPTPVELYCGRIKSFNAEKGFGFIESTEARACFGRDVFAHKTVIGTRKVGDQVTFTVETNKQGMPQAKNLTSFGAQRPRGKSGKDHGTSVTTKDAQSQVQDSPQAPREEPSTKGVSVQDEVGEAAAVEPAVSGEDTA